MKRKVEREVDDTNFEDLVDHCAYSIFVSTQRQIEVLSTIATPILNSMVPSAKVKKAVENDDEQVILVKKKTGQDIAHEYSDSTEIFDISISGEYSVFSIKHHHPIQIPYSEKGTFADSIEKLFNLSKVYAKVIDADAFAKQKRTGPIKGWRKGTKGKETYSTTEEAYWNLLF